MYIGEVKTRTSLNVLSLIERVGWVGVGWGGRGVVSYSKADVLVRGGCRVEKEKMARRTGRDG